jgi:hypothetical protein
MVYLVKYITTQDGDRRLPASLARTQVFQDFTAIFLGQVHVKQKKVRAPDSTIAIQIIDEGNNFVPVADDVELTFDLVFL